MDNPQLGHFFGVRKYLGGELIFLVAGWLNKGLMAGHVEPYLLLPPEVHGELLQLRRPRHQNVLPHLTRGVDSATRGVDSATGGVDSATRGVDSATRGVNSATRGVDSATRGVDSATRCRCAYGSGGRRWSDRSHHRGLNSPVAGVNSLAAESNAPVAGVEFTHCGTPHAGRFVKPIFLSDGISLEGLEGVQRGSTGGRFVKPIFLSEGIRLEGLEGIYRSSLDA
eukprot:54638-Prorocentrum_minimum.AAC.2